MSEKRRDNRNRILREGEYQRTDGRYRYRYIDEGGKEKQIQADLFDHIVTRGGNYTVVELVEKKVRYESEALAVYHGSFGYQRNAECLHPCAVR